MHFRKWLYVSLFLYTAICLAFCFSKTDKFQASIEKALQYEKEKEYRNALAELNNAIGFDSTKSFAFVLRGKIKSLLEEDNLAIQDLSKAIELNPKSTSAFFYKAISFSLSDNEDSAIANYDAAIHTKMSGDFYFEKVNNDFSDIEEQIDVELSTIKYFRGKALYNKKEDAQALEDFHYALSHGYNGAESQFYIGVILITKGQRSEGCSYLLKAESSGNKDAQEYLAKYCK